MSAIFGILRFDGAEANARELERMRNVLAHRGPDRQSFLIRAQCGLGQCQLRVNAEDLFEAQPLHTPEAGLTLVADARIDNREDLARQFGWREQDCRDLPDSAFILQAYRRWGEDAAAHLLGDFAFAVWDANAQKLILARDHMGQRALLWHRNDQFLAFANGHKALWAVNGVRRALSDVQWLRVLVMDQARQPGATIFEGIHGLPGGSVMTITAAGDMHTRRYWEPHADPAHIGRDLEHYVRAYRSVLEEAVACRLRRLAHPATLFFSGGFDSAAIAALSGPVMRAQNRKLIALCSGVPEGDAFARAGGLPRIAWCRRDMPHLDIRYVEPDLSVLTCGLAAAHADLARPLGLSKLLDLALFRQATSARARLVMDGHGGDCTLNPTAAGALAFFLKSGDLRRFRREVLAWRRHRRRSWFQIIAVDIGFHFAWAPLRGVLTALRAGEPLLSTKSPVGKSYLRSLAKDGAKPFRITGYAIGGGKQKSLTRLLRTLQDGAFSPADNVPTGCPLDFSRPFFDKRVIELALAIPERFDVVDGKGRALARMALAELYPAEFAAIEKGYDCTAPDLGRMVQPILREIAPELERLEGNPRLAPYLNFKWLWRRLRTESRRRVHAGQSVSLVIRSYLMLKFVEAFERLNR